MNNLLDTVTARSVGEVLALRLLRGVSDEVMDRVLVTNKRGGKRYVSWVCTQGHTDNEPSAVKAIVGLAEAVAQAPWETVPTGTLRVLADGLLAMAEAR